MITPDFSSIDRISGYLNFHVKRQKVIAGNLANLDTPGYRAQELDFSERVQTHMIDGKKQVQWSIETSAHVQDDEVPDQDGNSVSLEAQLAKSQANQLRYGAISELLRRKLGILSYACSDGGQ